MARDTTDEEELTEVITVPAHVVESTSDRGELGEDDPTIPTVGVNPPTPSATPPPAPAASREPEESVSVPTVPLVRLEPEQPTIPTVPVSVRRLRFMKVLRALNGIMVAALLAGLAYTLPRSLAYSDVLEENLALKERLDDIDDKMSEVDQMLLRLRLYDSQLKSLGTPTGDHGPVDYSAEDLAKIDFANVDSKGRIVGPSLDQNSGDVRAADAWAEAVEQRADAFLESMRRTEPHLTDLVVELEDLRALEAALPSRWPAEGAVTSGYGYRRNPVGFRDYRFHSGLDIANAQGTPVYAAADALVKRAEYTSGYGNILELDHGYVITTIDAHNRRLFAKKGDRVQGGDKIALMGSTGKSTGPHLHFEVRLDGNAVNPMDYLPRGSKKNPILK